jgi:predicted  nucleic acid-binding Zn-ribbon protein
MSVQRQTIPSSKEADIETTAELPVLDVAAYEAAVEEKGGGTDTWHVPALQASAASAAAAPAATPAVTPSGTPPVDRTMQLEIDLRSLSASLRDVEERLTRKGERLIELERELANSRAERAAAEKRAVAAVSAAEERAAAESAAAAEREAALNARLTALQADLAAEHSRASTLQATVNDRDSAVRAAEHRDYELASQLTTRDHQLAVARRDLSELEARNAQYLETLRTLEGRRVIFDGQLLGLDGEVDSREARITSLQQELGAKSAHARELEADLGERRQRVETLEREVSSLAASLAQRNVEFEQSERTRAKLQESVNSLGETLSARTERIRVLENMTSTQSETVSERSREIDRLARDRDAVQAKLTTLEAALASANATLSDKEKALQAAGTARVDLEKRLSAVLLKAEGLERDLAVARAEISERAAAVIRIEAERDAQINRFAASEARAVDLERRTDDQAESIRQLQEELRAGLNRATELEADLTAAEETIHRIEGELRAKSSKLDELTRTHEEWRSTIESARQSLAERDSLIHRLETEAANSAALLGNIQQSIKRLDPAAQSGPHPELAPEGAVRLLIRTDGDSEVVHVLGRKTTIGRTPDNDLQIDAKFISRNHAVILAGPNHTIIEDLNSTNGVAVNARRVSRHTLRDGDLVSIGKTTFRFAVRQTTERPQR